MNVSRIQPPTLKGAENWKAFSGERFSSSMRELHPGRPSRARMGRQKQEGSVLLELIAKPIELGGTTAGAQHHHQTPQSSHSPSPTQSA